MVVETCSRSAWWTRWTPTTATVMVRHDNGEWRQCREWLKAEEEEVDAT